MYDKIEKLANSMIQHGKLNDRIYLMKMSDKDVSSIIDNLEDIVKQNAYTKIFAKINSKHKELFIKSGYELEAEVPGFYYGNETALFMGKYFSEQRKVFNDKDEINNIIELSLSKEKISKFSLENDFQVIQASEQNAEEMAQVYKTVFETYPFPITKPEYLIETMNSHVDYFCILCNGRIVALSSSEMDLDKKNSEMTDFATLPEYRGKGLATGLLSLMESSAKAKGILTLYTIARANSPGMNITFAKLGYKIAGTLVNNTFICNSFESMNVWYKEVN
ncbi:MAG: putative beta-lysine N-acetyltransferase [Cyanobacteriota bacterium]